MTHMTQLLPMHLWPPGGVVRISQCPQNWSWSAVIMGPGAPVPLLPGSLMMINLLPQSLVLMSGPEHQVSAHTTIKRRKHQGQELTVTVWCATNVRSNKKSFSAEMITRSSKLILVISYCRSHCIKVVTGTNSWTNFVFLLPPHFMDFDAF